MPVPVAPPVEGGSRQVRMAPAGTPAFPGVLARLSRRWAVAWRFAGGPVAGMGGSIRRRCCGCRGEGPAYAELRVRLSAAWAGACRGTHAPVAAIGGRVSRYSCIHRGDRLARSSRQARGWRAWARRGGAGVREFWLIGVQSDLTSVSSGETVAVSHGLTPDAGSGRRSTPTGRGRLPESPRGDRTCRNRTL